jgi:hypothetical protein
MQQGYVQMPEEAAAPSNLDRELAATGSSVTPEE